MSGLPSSARSVKPSLRSAPEENPRPAPVTSTARTDSSSAACWTTAFMSCPNCVFHALRVSGRSSVIRPTPPSCSHFTVS